MERVGYSTSDMVVVGGGVIGLALGWRLAVGGARVAIVDAGAAQPPATLAAAGMLAPSFETAGHEQGGDDALSAALAAFGAASLAAWPAFAAELEAAAGMSVDLQTDGILAPAFTEAEASRVQAALQPAIDAGRALWLDRDEALRREPALASTLVGAGFSPGEGQVDARLVHHALQRAFANAGGSLRAKTRARRIMEAGGRATGVALETGETIAAPVVVLATGAHRIEAAGGLDGGVFPVKGEALALMRPLAGLSPRAVIRASGAYICPKADGRIVIGATERPREDDLRIDGARIDALRAAAEAATPSLSAAPEVERWAGLRPATADGAPLIGPAPDGPVGLFAALGHYRNGVLLAPETARLIARALTTGNWGGSLSAFDPARGRSTRSIVST